MKVRETEELVELDRRFIWHPFTQMKDWGQEEMLVVEEADGVWLKDTEGRRYIDGVSSLWVNVHGHRKREIDEAVRQQLDRVAHSTFLGLSNVPAIELAEKLIPIVPKGLTRVFYSDSGSEAVEVALKMAYQYGQQRRDPKPEKKKFIRFENAYHGDTVGAMSVGGIDLFFQTYKSLFFETVPAQMPWCYRCRFDLSPVQCRMRCADEFEKLIRARHREIAAVIIEPLMQAAAGMLNQPKGFVKRIRQITERYDVLLIADEVATGFGRTGKMFACEYEGVTPDLLVLGKGLTGGYLPVSATVTTEEIFKAFWGDYAERKTFFHGHSYAANPLGCAAAIANLELFEKEKTLEELQPKIEHLTRRLESFWKLKHVGDIRQAGFMVGIELVRDRKTKEPYAWEEKIGIRVCQHIRSKGVILRPLGPVIVLMPPLVIDLETLNQLITATYEAIQEVTEGGK